MRTMILAISLLFATTAYTQDSTAAKAHAKYWCDCLGEVDPKLPQDSIVMMVETCQSLSITNLLNKKIITLDYLLDSATHARFNEIAVSLMLQNCTILSTLLAEKKEPEPVYREENPGNIFTPISFFSKYGLLPGETNTRLHVYNMDKKDNNYQRSVDIRWVFENKQDALNWHRMNLQQNSEDGEPVKGTFMIEGAEEIKVYRESAKAMEMMKAFGIVQRQHYFIFVVENVVCKIFVATDGTIDSNGVLPFAKAAATQVKAFLPK